MEIAFRVRKIVDQMMDDRNNVIQPSSSMYPYTPDLTLDELSEKDGYPEDHLSSVYSGPDKPGGKKEIKTYVIFIPTKTENGKKSIVKFSDRLNIFMRAKIIKTSDRIIFISEVKLGVMQTKGVLENYSNIEQEYFIYSDLYINPTVHAYVPRHIFLSDAEKQETFKNVSVLNFSIIKKTDPMVRWYGALPGQVVRIERKNFIVDTMIDESYYYRIVKA